MDITPIIPAHYNLVQGYSEEGFLIANKKYNTNIIISPERIWQWDFEDITNIKPEAFLPIIETQDSKSDKVLLIIGTKRNILTKIGGLKAALYKHGINLETMNIMPACRTYNILVAEGREVFLALDYTSLT